MLQRIAEKLALKLRLSYTGPRGGAGVRQKSEIKTRRREYGIRHEKKRRIE